jgi:hypothetical protein
MQTGCRDRRIVEIFVGEAAAGIDLLQAEANQQQRHCTVFIYFPYEKNESTTVRLLDLAEMYTSSLCTEASFNNPSWMVQFT